VDNLLQIQSVNDLVDTQLLLQIRLVRQDQQRDGIQRLMLQQRMQLILCHGHSIAIRGIHDEDDSVDIATVALPHGAELDLAAQIPTADGDVAFLDLLLVEGDGWYAVDGELLALEPRKHGLLGEIGWDGGAYC